MMQASPCAGITNSAWLACCRTDGSGRGDGSGGAVPACWAMTLRTSARSSCSVIRSFPGFAGGNVDAVHDADDGGVDGGAIAPERFPRRPPFDRDQDLLVHPGANGIHGQQRHALRLIVD